MADKIYIGVGHGGTDPGAVGNGLKEKDVALTIARACYDELLRHGVPAMLSRTGDETEKLNKKIAECNQYAPSYALDIHINAGGGDGAEVFHTYLGGKGKTLAKNVLAEIKKTGQNSRGTKIKKNSSGKDYFGFIRSVKAPAVIVECAFIDNKKDIAIIDTKAEQAAMGIAIAKGILKTLKIEWMELVKEEPAAASGDLYRVFDAADEQVGAYAVEANAFAQAKKQLQFGGKTTITFGNRQ